MNPITYIWFYIFIMEWQTNLSPDL
jgi:hypothetical protein